MHELGINHRFPIVQHELLLSKYTQIIVSYTVHSNPHPYGTEFRESGLLKAIGSF